MKNFIALLFLFVSTLVMTNFLYNYADTSMTVYAINNSNNNLIIELDNSNEAVVKYSGSPYFFINRKESTYSNISIIENIDRDVYVKIYDSQFDIGIHNIKTYKILNHEHNFIKNDNLRIPSDCNESGKEFFCCTDCDAQKYELIEPLGCSYHFYSQKESSCTEEGYSVWRCERCGKVKKHSFPKLDHQFLFSNNIKKSTCIEHGEDLYTCYSCGEEKIEYLDYAYHSYIFSSEFNNGVNVGIINKCSYCGKTSNKSFTKQYLGDFQGVLNIPSLNVVVPVYCGRPSQPICDAANSASLQLYSLGIKPIIADHYYQGGFTNIRNSKVGSTIMYYQNQKYICSENFNGTNTGTGLVYPSGLDISAGGSHLYLYTCNDRYGKSIRIVGWNLA